MASPQTERQDDSALVNDPFDRAVHAHVRVVFGASRELLHTLHGKSLTIGREAVVEQCIVFDDSRMSRSHARIERGASGWSLLDLGSRNGAFVDGKAHAPNSRAPLRDGSVVRIGDSVLVFRPTPAVDDGRHDAPAFPGISPAAVKVRRRLEVLATAPGHVLVLGATGTGKERVSRALASKARFSIQNCAELTRELARSELFGHIKGAFSGAASSKPGLVDEVGDGTLFLDEVGELPLEVQGELLRFLEDGSYRPVGSNELRRSRARIVAATNVDIDDAVEKNRFRRDLAARLRASNEPLALPPLHERCEDIPQWVRTFLAEARIECPEEPWTAGVIECLLIYLWPENLRELRGFVRTLAISGETPFPWRTEHLPAKLRTHRSALRGGGVGSLPSPRDEARPLTEPTRQEIEAALAQTQGRMKTAAAVLGTDRRKLYRLCERYGIEIDAHREPGERDD